MACRRRVPERWRALVQGVPDPAVDCPGVAVARRFHAALFRHGGLALTAILVLGMAIALACAATHCARVLGGLGLACAGFVKFGVTMFFAIIAALVASCFSSRRRATLKISLDALADGARNALPSAPPARRSASSSAC